MKKRMSLLLAAALFIAAPALAAEEINGKGPAQTPFNCDFAPACEVAPGVYGNLYAPTTSKFNLSVGGFIKLDYAYNSVNLGPTGFLLPSSGAPKTTSAPGQKDQSIFSARQSRLWFKVAGPTFLGAKTLSLIEFDFHDPNNLSTTAGNLNATPRLRQAFANLDWGNTQLLFGQSADVFSGVYSANTIDFSGGTGGTGGRNPQIRLTQRVELSKDNALKLLLAVQQPYQSNFLNTGTNGAAGTTGDTWSSYPNVAAQALFISKALGVSPGYFGQSLNNFTAGFFGIYGAQNIQGQSTLLDSWGAGFYTFVPVLSSADGKSRANTLTFEGQTYLAANLPNFYGTATAAVGTAGNLHPAKGYGVQGQALYYPTQDLGLSAGYGRRGALNYATYKNISNFEQFNETIFVNASYDINAAIRVAVEYEHLKTQYGNATNATTAGSPLGGTSNFGQANIGRLALFYFF
jgi:hypothetical protein